MTASVTLALAVGANAAIFSLVNALWLRPLPVAAPDEVVVPYYPVVHSSDGELLDDVRLPAARELAGLSSFSAVTYELNPASRLGDWRPIVRSLEERPPIAATAVAQNYFAALGVPLKGRAFSEAEGASGAAPVAIISTRLWRRLTGTEAFIPGYAVPTTAGPLPVIGIATPGFHGPRLGDQVDLWITMGALGHLSEFAREPGLEPLTPVVVFARLRPGMARAAAEAEARTVLHRRTTLRSLRDVAFPLRSEGALIRQQSLIRTLWSAAALVLLLGCINLASVFTARTLAARRQFAIRMALGSSRSGLVRYVASEVAVLALAGLAMGLILRMWLLSAVSALDTSTGVPVSGLDLSLDWRTVVFSAIVSTLSAGIAAAGALRHAARTDLAGVLSGTVATISPKYLFVRQTLLAGHVALAMTLLVAALALVAAVIAAFNTDLGFDRDQTIFASVRPRFLQYPEGDARRHADYRLTLSSLSHIPAVAAVSYGPNLLRGGADAGDTPVLVDGSPRRITMARVEGGPAFLTAVGATFLAGRDLTQADADAAATSQAMMRFVTLRRFNRTTESAPNNGRSAAVIDERLASTLWPGSTAVGRSFLWEPLQITYDVVGVVKNLGVRLRGLPPVPTLIAAQPLDMYDATRGFALVIRTHGDAASALPDVTGVLRERFPDAPVMRVDTARQLVTDAMAQERMGARLFTWYAVTAVALGLAGIYGLLLFVVSESRRELAIRSALGASQAALLRLAGRQALAPVVFGTVAGLLLAYSFTRAMTANIVGLGDIGPGTYAVAALLFVGAAAFAAAHGARGVRDLNPAEVLQQP